MSTPYHSFSGPMDPENSKMKDYKKLRNDAIKIAIGSILVAYILVSAIQLFKLNERLGRSEAAFRELKKNHTDHQVEKMLLELQFRDFNASVHEQIPKYIEYHQYQTLEFILHFDKQQAIIEALNCSLKREEADISPEILIDKIWKPDPSKFENVFEFVSVNALAVHQNRTKDLQFRRQVYLENVIFEIGETPEFRNYTLLKYSTEFEEQKTLKNVLRIGDVPETVNVDRNSLVFREKTIFSEKRKIIFEKELLAVETERTEFFMKDGLLHIRDFKSGVNMTRVYYYC